MSKHGKPKARTVKNDKSFFVSVFLGTLISLLFGILLLTCMTLICLKLEDPERFAHILAIAAFFMTALLAGYLSARTHGEGGFFCGLLSGLLFVAILILMVFALSFTIEPSLFLICAPAAVIASALAGVCGVSAKKEKKPKHKKRF